MEERHPDQRSTCSNNCAYISLSLSALACADPSAVDDALMLRAATAPPSKNHLQPVGSCSMDTSNYIARGRRPGKSEESRKDQCYSAATSARNRLALPGEAASSAGGKRCDAPRASSYHHLSTASCGDPPPDKEGTESSAKGINGGDPDPGGATGAAGADRDLFSSSPLRKRFRSARRRGSKGWSYASSGWGLEVGDEAGGERAGAACAAAAEAGSFWAGNGSSRLIRTVLPRPIGIRLARRVIRKVVLHVKAVAALVSLSVAALGALLIGCSLYLAVRPWGRATYRRLLCSQLAAPLVEAASLVLPRTRVRITGDSDMLDGLRPCVIVSNTLCGNEFLGLDWWTILVVARAIGAHGYTKVLVSDRLIHAPVLGWILRILEFPSLGDCYQDQETDRDRMEQYLASFARDFVSGGTSGLSFSYLFLHFPEGDTLNRDTLASSLEFAKREGRPELMHLLLPHTTALSSCLDGLRPAKPVVYDVTLAAAGYSGEVPCGRPPSDWDILRSLISGRSPEDGSGAPCAEPTCEYPQEPGVSRLSSGVGVGVGVNRGRGSGGMCTESWCLCRTGGTTATGPRGFPAGDAGGECRPAARTAWSAPSLSASAIDADKGSSAGYCVEEGGPGDTRRSGCRDVHVHIKRYSLEEVVDNTQWLYDRWAEKDLLLAYFCRHQGFPSNGRGFPARRILDTRSGRLYNSVLAFVQLSAVPLLVPLLSFAVIPLLVSSGIMGLTYRLVSAIVRTVAMGVVSKRLARRIWCRPENDRHDGEENELGQGCGWPQSTSTPWWGGPVTPLNTPARGGSSTMPYITNFLGRGSSRGFLPT